MARPYRPDKANKPRPTFHKKEKVAKTFPGRAAMLANKGLLPVAVVAEIPRDNFVRIYLDDERPVPVGWTLAKNVGAFKELLAATDPAMLREISLDWHLGSGMASGEAAAEHLAEILRDRADEFKELRMIYCHSSDIAKAAGMARCVAAAIRERDLLGRILVDVGRPKGARP